MNSKKFLAFAMAAAMTLSMTACGGSAQDDVVVSPRPASRIPALRSANLDPADFAHSTCFDAGYLTVKNAGWRNLRPVIDAASCTGCLQCYLHCPDGTVYKVPSACRPTEAAGTKSTLRPAVAPDLAAMPKARVPKYPLRGLPAGRASPPPSPRSRAPGKPSLTHWANLRARPCSPRLPSPSTSTSARAAASARRRASSTRSR